MSALQWRVAADLQLIAEIIPAPHDPGRRLDRLTDVRIAADGLVLYVDTEQDVFAIPVASVVFVAYRRTG
ncbi:hypothetical protein [Streptacidiphilus cavernicola]|uniref:Uncharacterized protein n=1 Tax=Streptacidiphilus cavernicola TaxID=3342716 RepID=A0ABV6W0C9_9ACTN